MYHHQTEDRKIEEIAHYDEAARKINKPSSHAREYTMHLNPASIDVHGNDITERPALQQTYKILEKYVMGKRVLDYCCGHGIHAIPMARMGASEVVGIDLSEESLALARGLAEAENLTTPLSFQVMDAESLDLEDESFDVVFDGGALSSLDLHTAVREIHRVLKPGGIFIGVETLGHNPIMNIKRWLNVKRGTRTKWAYDHIFKVKNFSLLENYFSRVQIEFSELSSLLGQTINSRRLTTWGTKLDKLLFTKPAFQHWAFKTIFVFQKPW